MACVRRAGMRCAGRRSRPACVPASCSRCAVRTSSARRPSCTCTRRRIGCAAPRAGRRRHITLPRRSAGAAGRCAPRSCSASSTTCRSRGGRPIRRERGVAAAQLLPADLDAGAGGERHELPGAQATARPVRCRTGAHGVRHTTTSAPALGGGAREAFPGRHGARPRCGRRPRRARQQPQRRAGLGAVRLFSPSTAAGPASSCSSPAFTRRSGASARSGRTLVGPRRPQAAHRRRDAAAGGRPGAARGVVGRGRSAALAAALLGAGAALVYPTPCISTPSHRWPVRPWVRVAVSLEPPSKRPSS